MSPMEPGLAPSPANSSSSSIPTWLRAWWPALLWAALIFFFSTDLFSADHTGLIFEPLLRWLFPFITPDGFEFTHHLIRKSAHFIEYFVFFLLIYHGIRATRQDRGPWHWSWALLAWFIAAVYSALDEIHQIFVPSRGPSPWDSLLDSTGAFFALFVLFLLYRLFLRTRSD